MSPNPDRNTVTIRQRAMLLAVVCTMLPLWIFGLVLLFSGGQQKFDYEVAEGIRDAAGGQLNLSVKNHSERISDRMNTVGFSVQQLRTYAQEVLGLPSFYGGAANPPEEGSDSPLPATAPLDNPLYYSLGPEGAIRRLIDDGHPSVYFSRRNFDRYDFQRLFASAALDPLLVQPVAENPICDRTFIITTDNLVRTYPFFSFTHWEPDENLSKPRDYWSAAKADKYGLVWTSPYISKFSGQWVVACLGGIEIGGRLMGVAGAEIQVSKLEPELLAFSLGPGGMAWLAKSESEGDTKAWVVIATQDGVDELLRLVPLSDAPLPTEKNPTVDIIAEAELFSHAPSDLAQSLGQLADSGGGTASIGPPEDARHIAASRIQSTGWLLCGQIVLPAQKAAYEFRQHLDQRIRWQMMLFIIVLVLGILLAVFVAAYASGQLSRPLELLSGIAQRARPDEAAGLVEYSSIREVNALAQAIRGLISLTKRPQIAVVAEPVEGEPQVEVEPDAETSANGAESDESPDSTEPDDADD